MLISKWRRKNKEEKNAFQKSIHAFFWSSPLFVFSWSRFSLLFEDPEQRTASFEIEKIYDWPQGAIRGYMIKLKWESNEIDKQGVMRDKSGCSDGWWLVSFAADG